MPFFSSLNFDGFRFFRGTAAMASIAASFFLIQAVHTPEAIADPAASGDAIVVFAQSGNAPGFPVRAGSWGGKVRAGPGQQYRHIDGLQEGEDVILLEKTGVMMGQYPWFKIRFRNGRQGYKWGGILCAKDVSVEGIYQFCPGYERAAPSSTVSDSLTVHYSCEEGIPMVVRYDNSGDPGAAYFSHDSFPEVRLNQVISGSGTRYTNGYYTLSSKGGEAHLEWDGTQSFCTETQ